MSLINKVLSVALAAAVLYSIDLYAESIPIPYSIKQPTSSSPTAARKQGAHGRHDPHANLTPESQVQVALQHKAEGRTGEAFKTLDQAILLNQNSAELFAVRGSFYLEQNNISDALMDFESAIKIAPDSAAILTNRAQAYRHFGRINEALQDLTKAIQLNPDLMAAHFNRGAIHYSSQEYASALNDFDACIAIDPHAAGPYFNRASAKEALGDHDGAIADLKNFLEITSNISWKKTAQQLLDKWMAAAPAKQALKNDS